MIKKVFLFALSCTCAYWQLSAHAADLIDVYNQALTSDPTYQQTIAQQLSTKEGVPISAAALLPNIQITANPSVTRSAFSGSSVGGTAFSPRNNTQQYYQLALTLTQTVFNFAEISTLAGALATAKGADATLNAALQNLMVRTASAYFAVLKDEDNLSYSEAAKLAYAEQLDLVKQQYDVGLKTITDVYTAQASYDSAVANYIAAENTLADDRENLRVITGVYYPKLAALSEDFPYVTPKPANMEDWVNTSLQQNWSIKSAQYSVEAAKQAVRQQYAGHFPTVDFQGTLDRIYTNNINGYSALDQRSGPSTETDRAIQLNITVPVFSGGGVSAQTKKAIYNYQAACQQLELTTRSTANTARQSYLGVISGISQIKADKQAIKSSISSLDGMEASYRVGTEILVNVLNQQQKVFQAQLQYSSDRYAFVNNILALKQAAGTLSFDDLRAINAWLHERERPKASRRSLRRSSDELYSEKKSTVTKHTLT